MRHSRGDVGSLNGPEVGEAVRLLPSVLTIKMRVLAQQIGAMGGVQTLVAKPPGGDDLIIASAINAIRHGVLISPAHPLAYDRIPIFHQCRFKASPHFDCGMVTSPAPIKDGPANGLCLHPLLAKPAIVQDPGGAIKIRVWQKGLHTHNYKLGRQAEQGKKTEI